MKVAGQIVLPGEKVASTLSPGPGLLQNDGFLTSTKPGLLMQTKDKTWVLGNEKQYLPRLNEPVVGVVTGRFSEAYKVDIGSGVFAWLGHLSFEGATKRNKPYLEVGSVVYARISMARWDMEPELECFGTSGKSEGFGELKDGFLFKCNTYEARRFLTNSVLLQMLGKLASFEIAVGINGCVWINATTEKHTIVISNALLNSAHVLPRDFASFSASVAESLKD